MGSEQLVCPGCGAGLAMGQVQGFRQYVCPVCGGVIVGVAVLRQLSGEAGQRIWTAEPSAGPMTAATCPFCSTKMTPKTLPNGKAATCRVCEVVWLDKQAASSLPVREANAPSQGTLETQSEAARCQQCGAPVLHTWDERCQYCGAALRAPTQVVVLRESAANGSSTDVWNGMGNGHKGRLKEVLGFLTRPVG